MMIDTLVAGGYASEHDAKIARKLAGVLCDGVGGASREVTEDEMLELDGFPEASIHRLHRSAFGREQASFEGVRSEDLERIDIDSFALDDG